MSKKLDREEIVKEIMSAARSYKKYLVGKRFLYVFEGRSIEVVFKTENFRHLTGVATFLSAKNFYRKAVQNKLQTSQIYFDARHPYELCKRKICHLNEIALMSTSESFLLEEIRTAKRSFKFGTTDLNFTLCMDMENDEEGNEKGDCLVVHSLREGDCFEKSEHVYAVTHIFSKPNNVKGKYENMLFSDPMIQQNDLPVEIMNLIEPDVLK